MAYSVKSCIFVASSSQYVAFGNVLGFERTSSRTFSFWAKWSGSSTYAFIGKMDDTSGNPGFVIFANSSGQVEIYLVNDFGGGNYIDVRTNSAYNDGSWKHICITYDGSSTASGIVIYINGTAVAKTTVTDALSASIITTADFQFGARNITASRMFYDGKIDSVSIYNRVFTAAEALWIFSGGPKDLSIWGPTSNLIGWWKIGDGDTHPTMTDSSSGGNNGTMTNMSAGSFTTDPAFPTITLPGIDHHDWRFKVNIPIPYSRKCLVFTAASSMYVTFGDNFNFERTDTFTVSFWLKWSTNALYSLVTKQGDGTAYAGWAVYMDASGHIGCQLVNSISGNLYIDVVTTGTFTTATWHHVCITYSGNSLASGVTIYVDGSSQTKTTNNDTLGSNSILTSNNIYAGGRASSGSGQYFSGSMDELSLWNIELSSAQVTALYNDKAPTNLLSWSSPPSANLMGWWRMGDGDTAPTITDNSTGGHNGTMTNSPVMTSDWPTSGSVTTDHRNLLINIKNALTTGTGWTDSTGASATVTTPWTVVASSNGTTANTNDNWNLLSDIVFADAGSAHSWIVLQNSVLGCQICLDCATANVYQLLCAISMGTGFSTSSLSVTNRPKSVDEFGWWSSSTTWFNGNTAFNAVLNVSVTSDGSMGRWWGLVAGTCKSIFLAGKAKNVVSGWTNPVTTSWIASGSPLYTAFNDNNYILIREKNIYGGCFTTSEFYVSSCVGQTQTTVNSLSNEWPMNKMGLACGTPGLYGRHGEVSDMWWGSVTPSTGDTYPASGTLKQFIHIKDVILPWNQSTPVTT
jgi:hypothetical protein